MKATAFEFRFRRWILALIYVLGFWAPWTYWTSQSAATTTWLQLSGMLADTHWLSLSGATLLITVLAILLTAAGALLRTWGTAYLGASTVHSGALYGAQIMAAGPYRHVRNPLYLGSTLLAFGICILMPPTGAVFFLLTQIIFYFRLILREEAYLEAQQGATYLTYKQRVSRLLWSLRPKVAVSSARPAWLVAVFAEIFYLAFVVCFIVFAWRYNAYLLTKCLILCFGASLIVRALLPQKVSENSSRD